MLAYFFTVFDPFLSHYPLPPSSSCVTLFFNPPATIASQAYLTILFSILLYHLPPPSLSTILPTYPPLSSTSPVSSTISAVHSHLPLFSHILLHHHPLLLYLLQLPAFPFFLYHNPPPAFCSTFLTHPLLLPSFPFFCNFRCQSFCSTILLY